MQLFTNYKEKAHLLLSLFVVIFWLVWLNLYAFFYFHRYPVVTDNCLQPIHAYSFNHNMLSFMAAVLCKFNLLYSVCGSPFWPLCLLCISLFPSLPLFPVFSVSLCLAFNFDNSKPIQNRVVATESHQCKYKMWIRIRLSKFKECTNKMYVVLIPFSCRAK